MFFLDWGGGFGEDHPGHFHHTVSRGHATSKTLPCIYWPWSPGRGNVDHVSPVQSCPAPHFRTSLFGRTSPCLALTCVVGSCVPPPWRLSVCVNHLGFFFKAEWSLLPCLFIYSVSYEWTRIFILSFGLQSSTLYMLAQIVSLGPSGVPSGSLCVTSTHLRLVGGIFVTVLFWPFPSFLILQDAPGHISYASCPSLELAISPRSPSSFYWRIVLETKVRDFPGGAVVKNPPASAGDMGLIPGLGRSHLLRSS